MAASGQSVSPVARSTPSLLSCQSGREVCHDEAAAPLVVDRSCCPEPKNAWQRFLRATYARSAILRSSPIRIGLAFWSVFLITVMISGYGFYESLQTRTIAHLDKTLILRHSLISTVYENGGTDAVAEFAEQRQRELGPMSAPLGFFLAASDGSRIAGNISSGARSPGFHILNGDKIGLDASSDYRFLTRQLGDNLLSIGRSLDPLVELRAVALGCLIGALVVSTVLSILAAVWITRWFNCRLNGLGQALSAVANGNLAARVPLSYARDDIDDMALHVNAALDRLHDNIDSIRQVSTDIAHDLKTPLNRVYTYLDDAHRLVDGIDGPQAREAEAAIDEAIAESQHINSIFEALMRVTQIESGARRANFAPFDLNDVLSMAYEVFEVVAEESGKSLQYSRPEQQSLAITGDRELVLQMVVNLIENALHHGKDGVAVSVAGGVAEDGRAWIAVGDNGPGIPESEHDKVFRRLYRLEESRTTRGSGLGLSLVKAIADLHGASIELSDQSPGLVVLVTFPAES